MNLIKSLIMYKALNFLFTTSLALAKKDLIL